MLVVRSDAPIRPRIGYRYALTGLYGVCALFGENVLSKSSHKSGCIRGGVGVKVMQTPDSRLNCALTTNLQRNHPQNRHNKFTSKLSTNVFPSTDIIPLA